MLKFFSIFFIFLSQVFAFSIKIVANVGDEAITSRDVEIRAKLLKVLSPSIPSNSLNEASLEKLIQEKLLLKMSATNGFKLTDKELEAEITELTKKNPELKKIISAKEVHLSLKEQLRGEIMFSVILQGQVQGKLDFSTEEVERFKTAYNSQNANKINNEQAKQILTSMKINEAQSSLLKTLQESTLIEKK
jgi:hypothetical protein